MTETTSISDAVPFLGADWFDPLEAAVRQQVRGFIEGLLEEELAAALGRGRYERTAAASGVRNGHRERQLLGSFGPLTVSVPRARLCDAEGRQGEWRSKALPAYKRLTKQAEALIAGATLPAPTRGECAAPWRPCSPARSARTRSAGSGTR